MKLRVGILATLGAALALYLVTYVGWRAVFLAAISVGSGGFAALCLCGLGLFLIMGCAWRVLLPPGYSCSAWVLVRARMVRDSVAEVLPLSQFGGIAAGVRAAILQGVPAPLACASMVVDVTAEMVAQIAYAALGVVILVTRVPYDLRPASLITAALVGLAVATFAAALFVAVQRYGQVLTARIAAPVLRGAGQTITGVSAALDAIYRSQARVVLATALHFTAWIGHAAGAWLAFRLVGARIDLLAVIAIESLVYAIRSAAVLIPNALGVQEAAYALLGPLFGVAPELALAVSVLIRARDIVVGVPVLLIWQAAEGRRVLARIPVVAKSDDAGS